MGCSLTRLVLNTTLLLLLAVPCSAQSELPAGGNLLGQRGVLRSFAAVPQPAGWFGVGAEFQFFKEDALLAEGREHSRLINTYSVSWAPLRFLEASFAMHITSDNDGSGPEEELQVAVGDPEIALKGGVELGSGFAVGGLIDVLFPSAAGFIETSAAATSVNFAALASWLGTGKLPLQAHLNIGFALDGSENLFDDLDQLTPAQRYSAHVSSFNRVITRLALEYITAYVNPFVELSLEPYVGDGAPGFGDSPGILSLGTRVWPSKSRRFQVLAAVDVGITGVGDGVPLVPAPDKYAYVIPRWNLMLQMSYRFDPFAGPEVRYVNEGGETEVVSAPPQGVIRGQVLDSTSQKPIWNARVLVEGQEISGLAVNASDGSFRSYPVPTGKQTLVASAEGYNMARAEVQVSADDPAEVVIELNPRQTTMPGTLRGTIKTVGGQPVGEATVLIPELDRTIAVDAEGTFSVSLEPGEYKIVVSAKRLRTQIKTIRIQEGSTVILNVDLYR